jgi:hypothetical protein
MSVMYAGADIAFPATSAAGTPWRAHNVGRPWRISSPSSISS